MEEKLEVVQHLLHRFDYHTYFTADVSQKLSFILQAEDFILGLDDGKNVLLTRLMLCLKHLLLPYLMKGL